MELIRHYFPDLSTLQLSRFEALGKLYPEWNERINVISRKDIDNLYLHHVLHSLAIAKYITFFPGNKVLDVGTGGGFPGVPLAILFPETQFTLVDSIGKKITVVKSIAEELKIENITAIHERAEKIGGKFDFVISRAVTELPRFIAWVKNSIKRGHANGKSHGILYLKGGDVKSELEGLNYPNVIIPLSDFFGESFFETKLLVHLKFE